MATPAEIRRELPALLLIDAVRKRDFPQLQAAVLFLSFLYIIVNFAVDMCYGWLDPRTRA